MDIITTANIDWLSLWRSMYEQERQQTEALPTPANSDPNDCWAQRAERFAKASQQVAQPDHFMQFLLPHLSGQQAILDIGAGTGRYEPTLAQHSAHVYALEPSASMRNKLQQTINDQKLSNVSILAQAWPSHDIPEYDIAIAAHVVYAVADIGPFLQGMQQSAKQACFLLVGYQHPGAHIARFWEYMYNTPRHRLPGALECLCALHQLGINAHLTPIPISKPFSYYNQEEAQIDISNRLRLDHSAETQARLQQAIQTLLHPDEHGRLRPHQQEEHHAVLWWYTK
jgi:SAM-dependent methyltransferase